MASDIPTCRGCNVLLEAGENWPKSGKQNRDYICSKCRWARRKAKSPTEANRLKNNQYQRRYREKHSEEWAAYYADWRSKNRDRIKQYQEKQDIRRKLLKENDSNDTN